MGSYLVRPTKIGSASNYQGSDVLLWMPEVSSLGPLLTQIQHLRVFPRWYDQSRLPPTVQQHRWCRNIIKWVLEWSGNCRHRHRIKPPRSGLFISQYWPKESVADNIKWTLLGHHVYHPKWPLLLRQALQRNEELIYQGEWWFYR